MSEYSLIIGGQRVAGASRMAVINPATEQVVSICPRGDAAQMEAAVAAAKAAFPAWSQTPIAQRREKLLALADALEARTDEIARVLTAEQGKPLADAVGEVAGSAYILRALAELDIQTEVLKEDETGTVVSHRTALGVVAAITPWNFPISILVIKIVPALLAGNTVVAKPAPTTPLSSLLIGEIADSLLPPGVFNIVTDDNDLGGLLTAHPDVAKVSFTGSTATGKKVMQAGASDLKRITLELGGNDAAIVLEGCDPKEVAPKLFAGAMMNAGQVCLAIKRVYAPEAIYDALCDELGKLANQAVVGDGAQQGTEIGPLQNRAQFEKVKGFLDGARRDGRIVAGGEIPDGPGYFVRPTIVRDIGDDAPLVREEQFGPILPVLKYASVEDAIARVNDSQYGLGGTVWAADRRQGLEVALRIDSGLVWVNQHLALDPAIATGGAKHSGVGHELGLEGLHEFTQSHVIYVAP